jgi:hypothetical protein
VDDKTLAHPAHPSTEDHDDTVEAHYASLERPHACNDGWVTIGQIALDPETGEEVEEFALLLAALRRLLWRGLRFAPVLWRRLFLMYTTTTSLLLCT